MLFLGHFHPLLVHLPIGGLVLLGFLELLALLKPGNGAAQSSRLILGFVCGAAVASAACGWMLARAGGYDPQLLKWHQAAGLALAGACLATFLLRQLERPRAYRLSLFTALVLLAIASHLGGSITHGRDFLTRFAPAPLRASLRRPTGREIATHPAASSPTQQPVFVGIVEPILRQRCSACHGVERHKAKLRLDTLEGLLQGGQNGPVIKLGHAKDSPLIQRMLLPLDADGRMPPEEQPQPTPEEIALLEWWINAGAPAAANAADLKPEPEIRRLLGLVSKRPDSGK